MHKGLHHGVRTMFIRVTSKFVHNPRKQIVGNAGDSKVEPEVATFVHFLYTERKTYQRFRFQWALFWARRDFEKCTRFTE